MRCYVSPQAQMFNYFSPEQRVPAQHPLRLIKAYTDSAFKQIRQVLDGIYSQIGRPSIPPMRLLKAQLLIALYSGVPHIGQQSGRWNYQHQARYARRHQLAAAVYAYLDGASAAMDAILRPKLSGTGRIHPVLPPFRQIRSLAARIWRG